MEKVKSVLSGKQPHFNVISINVMINDAINKMNDENSAFLIVMEDGRFCGLLTEHDIASKAMLVRKPLHEISVKEMMNTKLPFVGSEDTLERCMKLMRLFNVRHLPVFENFQFKGIISIDDILQEAILNRSGIFDSESEEEVFSKIY